MKAISKTDESESWLTSLADKLDKALIQTRIDRLQDGNAGDVAPVGGGVSELKLHFGCGWRMYYTERNGKIIILLAGNNKGMQNRDIER